MNKINLSLLGVATAAIALSGGETLASTFTPVDFSASHNWRIQSIQSSYPEGDNTILGGVPFNIPTGGNNGWYSLYATGSDPRTLEISVGLQGIQKVHTLINTGWGQPGPNSYARLEFEGTGGAFYSKDLIGDDDMREWANFGSYTNNINGTTTIEVFSSGVGNIYGRIGRLDKQEITLPPIFATETLNTIRVIDNGADNFQRIMFSGVTLESDIDVVPEPITILGTGLVLASLPVLKKAQTQKISK